MAAESSPSGSARDGLDPDRLMARVDELTRTLESTGDALTRAVAEDLTGAIVQLYGAALERVVEAIAASGEAGRNVRDALVEDELVATLLLVHDLYPVPLEERVAAALDQVRPYMESHGGDVELLAVADGVAHLRLRGSCRTCSASASTLELAVRQALEEAAPDLEGMEVEGVEPAAPAGPDLPLAGNGDAPAGFELPIASSPAPAAPSWFDVAGAAGIEPEEIVAAEVAGASLVIANVDGTLLAYRNACAECGGALDGGRLRAGTLTCPSCSRSFLLPRAGRAVDDERVMLEPVPLLRERESVRVALAAG
jgi:Fe-S cluster biogenesis protein NfuA/nitrite reductase/ring-hydroxylating ferredoxin subunit